ncbi:transposase [Streptomyces sp. NPDC050743]|uniref:transposase n=1 Tax=Streptomyces sp. NPDC050743 TaxID=3365634 RepID=UPI0037B2B854
MSRVTCDTNRSPSRTATRTTPTLGRPVGHAQDDQAITSKSSDSRRVLSLQPRGLTEAIQAARARVRTGGFNRDYALRAGIEDTIRRATHTTGLRRARYRGLAKIRLDHAASATALSLIRVAAWGNGHPLDRANHSHLARLQLSLAA